MVPRIGAGLLLRSSHTDGSQQSLPPQNLQELPLSHRDLASFRHGRLLSGEHIHQDVVEVCHGLDDRERVLHFNVQERIEGFHTEDLLILLGRLLKDGANKSDNTDSYLEETIREDLGRLLCVDEQQPRHVGEKNEGPGRHVQQRSTVQMMHSERCHSHELGTNYDARCERKDMFEDVREDAEKRGRTSMCTRWTVREAQAR